MFKYLNENGLKNGLVPAGKPCPFTETCNRVNEGCPSVQKPHASDFSCALARAHSMLSKSPNNDFFRKAVNL